MTFTARSVSRKFFTPAEDVTLTRLVSIHGSGQWAAIAHLLPGRNARQCRERWRTVLRSGLLNGPWSREEDELLVKLYNEHGPKWSFIAKSFNGRSDANVKNRWARHLHTMMGGKSPEVQLPQSGPMAFGGSFGESLEWGLSGQLDNCCSAEPFINW
jgi:hypothetical protein